VEVAGLERGFNIPVEALSRAEQPDAESLALFDACPAVELRRLILIVQPVQISLQYRPDGDGDVAFPQKLILIGVVIELAVAVVDRANGEQIDRDVAQMIVEAQTVEVSRREHHRGGWRDRRYAGVPHGGE
jgi:hypothetical protein